VRHTAFFGGRSTFAVFLRLPGGRARTVQYLSDLRQWKPKHADDEPPRVPPRTQFALARRMMLVDDSGAIAPTRLTESVQVRVLHGLANPGGDPQSFVEFRLRRRALIAGRAGGLGVVERGERDRGDMLELGPNNDEERRRPILESCRDCHASRGILSMNSYTGAFDNFSRLRGARTLAESPLRSQEEATVAWKRRQYSWGLWTGLKEGRSPD
jgi:hypothetical protein